MDCRKMATLFWKRKVLPFTKIVAWKTPVTNKSDNDYQRLDEDEDFSNWEFFNQERLFLGNLAISPVIKIVLSKL